MAGTSNPKARPYRLIGGATEQNTRFSDILAIARKPIVENSKTLHFWNPWVNRMKMAISDFICAWIVFPPFWNLSKTYFCELVLGFSPDRNQTTAEMFSVKWISIIIEKKLKFQLTFAKGRKHIRKRRGQFHLNSYNSWTEWDIFTKLRTHVNEIILWSNKSKLRSLATWWRYKIGKTVTSKPVVRLTWNLV